MLQGGLKLGFGDVGDQKKKYIRIDDSGIMIHNLSKYATKDAAVSAIREIPGIYAWFETIFPFDENEDVNTVVEILKSWVLKNNFPRSTSRDSLTGVLQPTIKYNLEIGSHNSWTDSLQSSMDFLLKFDSVRDVLDSILKYSLIFQPPLYIGCSKNLRTRIEEHLQMKTGFAKRYADNTQDKLKSLRVVTIPIRIDQDDLETIAENQDVKPLIDSIEDLLSRIYKPQWNKRYG